MTKYGFLRLKETNREYGIVWYTNMAGFERVDIVEDWETYNLVETSNCVASYYKKQQERYLGDTELIKRVHSLLREMSIFKGKTETVLDTDDNAMKIITTKVDEHIGYKSILVLNYGKLDSELYETPETLLVYNNIEDSSTCEAPPVNLQDYATYSITGNKFIIEDSTADYYSLETLLSIYPLEHMKDYDFVVVDSMATATTRLKQWAEAPTKVKAIDLETTGLEWYMYGKDVIVGIVLSWNENESTYYPFRQENFKYNLPIGFMQVMLDTIRNQPSDVMIIGHNAKVEKQGIWKEDKNYIGYSDYARKWDADCVEHGLENPDLRIDGDSMLLSIILNPVFERSTHALKSLAANIRKKFFLSLEQVFKNKANIKFNVLPPEIVKYYACPDTANTICVWNHLIKKIPKSCLGILELENHVLDITAQMEFFGMRTDRKVLIEGIANEEFKVAELGDMFRAIHKTSKNINSNKVLQDIFYNKLRCKVEVWTKTGQPSTSAIALKRIVENGTIKNFDKNKIPANIVDKRKKVIISGEDIASNKYPSLVILQVYNKSRKELGAFKRIERKSARERVMFGLNQAGAATGRQTSDAHQYSDGMKEMILSDSKHHFLWSADFKQIELRILAYIAGQQDLIESEKDPDVDIHRAILSILTGKPIYAISAKERKKGKSTNFGVVYKMSAYGLAKKNAGPGYTREDVVEALAAINGFYNGLPNIKLKTMENEEFVKANGYMKTKFGRYRYFPRVLDPTTDEKTIAADVRAANNFPIQGFGADYLKICEYEIYQYIKKKGWDKKVNCDGVMLPMVRVMLPIHDEFLVSSHKSIPIEEIIIMFKVCMEQRIENAPPFFSAPALVDNWADGKLDKYEIDLSFRDKIIEAWDRKKQRLLHVLSYNDSFDYQYVDQIKESCKRLRVKVLQDRDLKDIKDEELLMLSNEVESHLLKDLVKHFIKEPENMSEDSAKILAMRRALDKEFSHYLTDLNEYRSTRLKSYMDDLIQKYKTVDEVAAHVQHNELTHTLISVEIEENEKFEHMEAIREATRRYMESEDIEELLVASSVEDNNDKEYIETFDNLEKYIQFDDKGEVIEDETGLNEDEDDLDDLNESIILKKLSTVKRTYITYTLDEAIVDLSDFDKDIEKAKEAINSIRLLSNNKAYYKVAFFCNNKLTHTKMRLDYNPQEIDTIMEDIKNSKMQTVI